MNEIEIKHGQNTIARCHFGLLIGYLTEFYITWCQVYVVPSLRGAKLTKLTSSSPPPKTASISELS